MDELLVCTGILAILIGIVALVNLHVTHVSHKVIVAKLDYLAEKPIDKKYR